MAARVLVVARGFPSYDAPGRGSFVADQVRGLVDAGAGVVIASFETVPLRGPEATRIARARAAEAVWVQAVADPAACNRPSALAFGGVPVARLPVPRTWGALDGSEVPEMGERHAVALLAFGRAVAARQAAAGAPFDVIHAHNGLPDGLAAMSLATELDLPLVVTEHDSTLADRLARPEAREAYRRLLHLARVVVVSSAVGDRIARALEAHGSPTPTLEVLPNPVPLDLFPASGAQPRDPDELLWVGARAPHKGFETLLRAVALARTGSPGLHLRAIGPATEADDRRWQALARELGITDAVIMAPAADRPAVATAMQRAGLFVHPSPFETFGMVAAEALASGLPVAATPSGGVEAILGRDGRFGEIAADTGAEALAEAILRLHGRLPAIDRTSLRATIEDRFAPRTLAARTLELYADARASAVGAIAAGAVPSDAAPATASDPTPVAGVLVVAGHASAASRLTALPSAPIPVRIVGPTSPPRPSRLGRLVGRATGRTTGEPRSAQAAAIRAARDELARTTRGRLVIVPAEVDDLHDIIGALGPGAASHIAPGSLRWLADLQDAARGPMGR